MCEVIGRASAVYGVTSYTKVLLLLVYVPYRQKLSLDSQSALNFSWVQPVQFSRRHVGSIAVWRAKGI
jgi:hypothetical protein